jgi:hypothetical protein
MVQIKTPNIYNLILWTIIIISFILTVSGILISESPRTNVSFEENISDSTIDLIAIEMKTNYGLINKSDNKITNVKAIQFTNSVMMETDQPCVFRFRVDECSDDCLMKKNGNLYFDKFSKAPFTMEAAGTENDSFVFPVPAHKTFIIKNGDDNSVADWFY